MRIILFISFSCLSLLSYSQSAVVKKVTSELCDTLKKADKPLAGLSVDEIAAITDPVISANYRDWTKEVSRYKEKTGLDQYLFNKYVQHILVQDCREYRVIEDKLDDYLAGEETKRRLYRNTKDFIYALEDGEDLSWFFKDQLISAKNLNDLELCKKRIRKLRRRSTLAIGLVGGIGYTYRVTFFNYLTDEPEFRIDVIYTSDSYIEMIKVKDKEQLAEEEKKEENAGGNENP